jgi:hypothetical protein
MKKLAVLASVAILATSSFAAENSSSGWLVGTFGTFKSTKAEIKTESTSGASSTSSLSSSSSGTGLMIGRAGEIGRVALEFDKSSKAKGVENMQISVAYDMIIKSGFVDPILGFDVGYNSYRLDHLGTQNAFGLGTLGLRAGVAKRFDAHQIELLYRYGMAFGSKRGGTVYQVGVEVEDQSLSGYRSNELRIGYSYKF